MSPQWSLLSEGKAGVELQSAEDGVDLPVRPISSDQVGDHRHQALVLSPQPLIVDLEVGESLQGGGRRLLVM